MMNKRVSSPKMRQRYRFESNFWSKELIKALIKDYGFPKDFMPEVNDKDSISQVLVYHYGSIFILAYFDCYELDDIVVKGFYGQFDGKLKQVLNYLDKLEG